MPDVDLPMRERTFDWRDEYDRLPVAKKLLDLLTSDIDGLSPVVIDGGWGSGKTEFCWKTINLFKADHEDYQVIHVDAFEADHGDEPLMTLLAAVAEHLPKDKQRLLIQQAIPAIRFAAKTGLKAAVSWALRQDAVDLGDSFEKEVKRAGDAAIDAAVESTLRDHIESRRSIETLREALGRLAEKKPIVVFVDELDRCRPDFAISMLESIKHVFAVGGVQFVLVTNTEQLRASIRHVYGLGEDGSQRYLDKFLGFSFALPDRHPAAPRANRSSFAAVTHFRDLVIASDWLNVSAVRQDAGHRLARTLIESNQRSLREVETWVRYLEIYQIVTKRAGFNNDDAFIFKLLRILATYVFCFEPDAKREIQRGMFDAERLAGLLGKSELPDPKSNAPEDLISALLLIDSNVGQKVSLPLGNTNVEDAWKEKIVGTLYHLDEFGEGKNLEELREVFLALELGARE